MKHILICLAALLAGAAATAQSVDQSGVGAGGYAGASAIHSSNNMIMGLGTDMNGCMLNTSGVDDAQWTPWREGLWPDSGGLTSNVQDMIHVDYTPAFGGSSVEGWFAATVGGIFFSASDGGSWSGLLLSTSATRWRRSSSSATRWNRWPGSSLSPGAPYSVPIMRASRRPPSS